MDSVSHWSIHYYHTCRDFFLFKLDTKQGEDGYLVSYWCQAVTIASVFIFVIAVICPILKKRQFSIASIGLTTLYVAIWIWLLKEINPYSEYNFPLAISMTLFCAMGSYVIWKNRVIYKLAKLQ